MRPLFLLFLVFTSATSLRAEPTRDLVVWVVRDPGIGRATVESVGTSTQEFHFRKLLRERGATFETVILPLQHLGDLAGALRRLRPEFRLRGMVVAGHGNDSQFAFTPDDVVDGATLASSLATALSAVPLTTNFTLQLTACLVAQGKWFGANFEAEFIERWKGAMAQLPPIRHLQLVLHRDVSNKHSYRPVGALGKKVYATGVPTFVERMSDWFLTLPDGVAVPTVYLIYLMTTVVPPYVLSRMGAPEGLQAISLLSGFALRGLVAYSSRLVGNALSVTRLDSGVLRGNVKGMSADLMPAAYGCSSTLASEGSPSHFGLLFHQAFRHESEMPD